MIWKTMPQPNSQNCEHIMKKWQTFNQKIADADIAFIHGRIDDYQKRLDVVVPMT